MADEREAAPEVFVSSQREELEEREELELARFEGEGGAMEVEA